MNLFRRTKNAPFIEAAQTPAYTFCEPVSATATSHHHIRQVGSDGIKPGGGILGAALCGRDVSRGWDLAGEVTVASVGSQPRPGDGRVFVCPPCAEKYLHHHLSG